MDEFGKEAIVGERAVERNTVAPELIRVDRRPSESSALEACRLDLERSESRNRVLFAESPLALIVYDPVSWRVLEVNAACARILGYTAQDWVGQSVGFAVEREQRAALHSLTRKLADSSTAGSKV